MKNTMINDLIVNQFVRSLEALNVIIDKAVVHSTEKNFDVNTFMNIKFAPDMFTFCKQVQIATDTAKGAVARLSGKSAPVFKDDETTIAQLQERIKNTIHFVNEFSNCDFTGYESKIVTFPWYAGKAMNGHDYLVTYAIPNFYFHVTTAYDLLRANGVTIGKADFLGNQPWTNV